jgi:ADP-ribose diphosphatase
MAVKPKALRRTLAAETRIFRVEQIELEFSSGTRRCFERILSGPGSVLVVPMQDARTMLLIREYAAGTERYELGFPKGIVEPGEDALEAAGREIREEIGFGARDLRLVKRLSLAPGYLQHQTDIVLAQDLYPDPAAGDEPEPIEVIPWGLDDIEALVNRDDFAEARSIAALFLVGKLLNPGARNAGPVRGPINRSSD